MGKKQNIFEVCQLGFLNNLGSGNIRLSSLMRIIKRLGLEELLENKNLFGQCSLDYEDSEKLIETSDVDSCLCGLNQNLGWRFEMNMSSFVDQR